MLEENLRKILEYFTKDINNEEDFLKNLENFLNDLKVLLGKDQYYFKILYIVYKNESIKNNTNNNIKNSIIKIIANKNENKFFNFINFTNEKLEKIFIKRIKSIENYKNKYPILFYYIREKEQQTLKNLKYIEQYNKFCNFMINTYSYKITREEAKEKKLKDEEIFDQKLNKKLFNDFLECWNIIKAYAKNEK